MAKGHWMNKTTVVLAALVLQGLCIADSDRQVSVEVTADFSSKYIWRGQNITDDWVFQPGISAAYADLRVGYWGNVDLTSINDESGRFIEHDWYVDYSRELTDTISLSVGAIYYRFPSAGETTELYWGVGLSVPASPTLNVYHDTDAVDGTYAAIGLGHRFENPDDLPFTVDIGASLGWAESNYNHAYWDVDSSALNDLTFTAGFPFDLAGISITPSVTYLALVDSDIRAAAEDDCMFVVGISLAREF